MPKGWREVEELPRGAKLLDDYGSITSRWRAAADAGADLPDTWVLDKKRFRRALDAVLPPGHRLPEILADRSALRRAAKAARAFERLTAAALDLPLPEWPEATRAVVLWSSPVARPRGVELSGVGQCVQVPPEPEAVRRAVGRLWASVYLEPSLQEIVRRGAKRVDIVVGLTALEDPASNALQEARSAGALDTSSAAQSWTALLTDEERTPTGFPFPGATRTPGPQSALALDVGAHGARAFGQLLRERWGRVGARVVQQDSARWQWEAQATLDLMAHARGPERAALCALLGLTPPPETSGLLARWKLGVGRVAGKEALRQGGLASRVAEHELRCDDVLAGWSELDLAVLPDDGLKRTLEDAHHLLARTAELVAETTWSAELLLACCESLAPGAAPWIDAGLNDLPWVTLLAEWEERMALVRHDGACRAALSSEASLQDVRELPEGPGRRALTSLLASHGFLAANPLEPACPRLEERPEELLRLARLALERPCDVPDRCRAARFAADRALAAAESSQGRLVAVSFGALRSLAREAVVRRERLRLIECRAGALLRRLALDVDRRLRRLEPGLPAGAAFDCTVEELLEAVDLRGSSLRARVAWRRAERDLFRRRREPWFVLDDGESAPGGAREIVLSPGTLEESPWIERLDALWLLALGYVPGARVRWAAPGDAPVVLARALGVPLRSTLGRRETPSDARVKPEAGDRWHPRIEAASQQEPVRG